MGLETGDKIGDLNPAWPLGTDPKSQGDDHIRLIKAVLQNDATDAATLQAAVDALQASIDEKVAKAGDTMTGILKVPDGVDGGDAVNKGQLDAAVSSTHDPANLASWSIQGTTLECWGFAPAGTITFPKTFARAPVVTGSIDTEGVRPDGEVFVAQFHSMTETSVVLAAKFANGGSTGISSFKAMWRAVGEWDGVS